MKKMAIALSVFIFILILTSCDPGRYHYNYDDLTQNVISIELVEYENPKQKHFMSWVPDHSSDLVALEIENMLILETLVEEQIDQLLLQLSEIDILYKYYAYDSPKGICIKLNHKNNDFDILSMNIETKSSSGYIGCFTSAGSVKEFKGTFARYEDFENLINTYFETKI